jgi:hypothetical protein
VQGHVVELGFDQRMLAALFGHLKSKRAAQLESYLVRIILIISVDEAVVRRRK